MTKITLAVTGSIAAYKAADLTSLLTKEGHDVTVLMTKKRYSVHHSFNSTSFVQK